MKLSKGNLFDATAGTSTHGERREQHDDLYVAPHVRITRIESNAHQSPAGFWYDQPDDEWVAVIAGDAVIEFDDGTRHRMQAGDWLVIPARCRHRVAETGDRTIWLAVHSDPFHHGVVDEG